MPRKREDMTDEEYQAMLKRLSAMREKSAAACAAKKAARLVQSEPLQPVQSVQSEPIGRPISEQSELVQSVQSEPIGRPVHVDEMPTPLPPPPRQRKAKPIPIAPQPKPQVMDETELDKYFAAKYKWKNAYAAPPVAPPQPIPMVAAVRATAQDQIRNRVNDEVMKMAMKSVFPDWN